MDRAPTPTLATHVRGSGDRIVCLHSSTGTQAQWRTLQDRLATRWEVLAPDLHGHGRSPTWPAAVGASLDVDAAAVVALAGMGEGCRVHLVGHSYGAAVALQIALRHPALVRSLTLYEPVAFGLLQQGTDDAAAHEEITEIAASVAGLVRVGADTDAARVFVGYWGGAGAWAALSDDQRRAIVSRMPVVPRHFEALFGASWSVATLQRLRMPVLLLNGSATRAAARRVSERLVQALPQAQRVELPGAGHLGPLTHRETVAQWMLMHLDPQLAGEVVLA